jgi:hypothetical protein
MLPMAWAVCLDVGTSMPGAMSDALNTADQLGSTLTSLAFGYLVRMETALSPGSNGRDDGHQCPAVAKD